MFATHSSFTIQEPSLAWFLPSAPGIVFALCAATVAFAQSDPAIEPDELNQLHSVLQSDTGRLKKIEACKKLAAIGTRQSVPILAPLLTDPDLSHAARIGLEAIPDPAAGEALRTAIPKLKGELLLVGVINSIGARRDAEAVTVLQGLLQSQDSRVASAVALALGRIASNDAVAALIEAVPSAKPSVQIAIGQGGLIAADQCRRDGRLDTARQLCDRIAQAQLPAYIRLSATRGQLLSGKTIDRDRLAALVRGDDEAQFAMALVVVREFPGDSVTGAIADQLDQVSAARQVLLVAALGDRGDEAALPAVLTATKSAHKSVRDAATRCLANFKSESVWPKLLAMACDPDEVVSEAARDALVLMAEPAIDEAILRALENADTATRIVVYDLIGRRHIGAGVSALLQGAEAEELQERVAAIAAIGKTIPANQLGVLTQRLLAESSPEELEAVKAALIASCVRLGDAESCAKEIVACLPKTSGALHLQLYDLLGLVGGPTALKAVTEASKDPDPEMQDTITRVLGQWMTPDAAPLLLAITQSEMQERYRIRALRGYIRILRQFDMTNRQRIQMCSKAMPLAERKEERMLMLEALLRVPARETLSLALSQLDSEDVSHRACEVALLLSNALAERHPDAVINAMERVLANTQDATFKGYAQQLLAKARKKSHNEQ